MTSTDFQLETHCLYGWIYLTQRIAIQRTDAVNTQVPTCSQRVPVDRRQEGVTHHGAAAARPAPQPPRRIPRHQRPNQILLPK